MRTFGRTFTTIALLNALLAPAPVRAQINRCHQVEFSLYRFDASEVVYENTWFGDVALDWTGPAASPLPAGEYGVTILYFSGVSNLRAPDQGACLLMADLEFSLDTTPQPISQNRSGEIRTRV